MSGIKMVLDTNILLYLLSDDETLESFLDDKDLYISFINEMEILSCHGITEKEKTKIISLLSICTVIELNPQIKDIRRKHRIKLPDSMVAATAWYLKSPLISADKAMGNVEDTDFILYTP